MTQGKLILHLGPPKTATTALQIALIEKSGDYIYGGAAYPARDKADMASRLHKMCLFGPEDPEAAQNSPIGEISEHLATGRDVLISEELFLVDGARATYVEKLSRLAELVAPLSPTVLLCLREPLEGVRSLYQELYAGIPLKEKLSFDAFIQSPQAEVFAYGDLANRLETLGFTDIRWVRFEDLVQGRVCYSDILGRPMEPDELLRLPVANASRVAGQGATRRRRLGKIRLRDFVPLRMLDRLGLLQRIRSSGMIGGIRLVSGLTIRGEVEAELPIPDDIGLRLESQYQHVARSGKA